jgi:molybdate transport system substrate-binding protein
VLWFQVHEAPLIAQGKGLLRVAAASDLQFALEEVVRSFEQKIPAISVQVTFGSSGNFFSQISNGAPFDLYLSADITYPQRLETQGLTVPDSRFIYAVGRLALWIPATSPLEVEKLGEKVLLDRRVERIALANPRHAPYGRAAEEALKSWGIHEALRSKLVYGENVAQAFQFVQSGMAEIGIVALSLTRAPQLAGKGKVWEVPLPTFTRLEQGGVILKSSPHLAEAGKFREFLLSPEGREILKRFGFVLPGE